jgi:CRISPR-associated exonuclease Cas4
MDHLVFPEADLLPLSSLQHLVFCERQWALIHLEGQWEENRLTVEGHIFHERVDESETEVRGDLRIARGLRLRSLRLGLVGKADVVEFQRVSECGGGVSFAGVAGRWQPVPVEYKRGRPKPDHCDEVQLCAQALCLEEMLGVEIPGGFLYYGQPHRRTEVAFGADLRTETEALAVRLHELWQTGKTPPAVYERKCRNCSLIAVCLPKTAGGQQTAQDYLLSVFEETT